MGKLRSVLLLGCLCSVAAIAAACGESNQQTTGGGQAGDGGQAAGTNAGGSGGSGGAGGSGASGGGGNATGGGGSASGGSGQGGGNQPPEIVSTPPATAKRGETLYYPVLVEDPDGDPLAFSLPAAPPGMTIDADTGLVAWTPAKTDSGAFDVTVRVQDPAGAFDEQAFSLGVVPGTAPPVITSVPPLTAQPGSDYVYSATAEDPDDATLTWTVSGPAGVSVDAAGKVTWPVPAGASGGHVVTLTVSDPQGLKDEQVFSIGVPANNGPPTVAITAPAPGAVIGTSVDVIGTANDVDLAGYTLDLCPLGWGTVPADCRRIKTGLAPVQNGVLARLPPFRFPNGGYELVLAAKDAQGASATTKVPVRIESHKLGALRLVFDDLSVIAGGTEITLSRVYDGLNLVPGELGPGWQFEWSMFGHGEQPAEPHTGWEVEYITFPPGYEAYPTNGHPLYFELSDGRQYTFELLIDHDNSLGSVHPVRPQFQQLDGFGANLDALKANGQAYSETAYDLWLNFGYVSEDIVGDIEWKPAAYRLTTEAGEQLTFDAKTGKLTRYYEPGGLEFDPKNNVVRQNGQDVIQIVKGPDGLVTSAKDVLTGAEVKYTHDAATDLVAAVGVDGSMQSFTYASGHRMTSYGSTGIAPVVYEYDAQGRVVKRIGPDGSVTLTTYDDASKKVIQTNAAGHELTTTYDDEGRVVETVDPLGAKTTYTYVPGTNRMATTTDPLGRTTTFGYDAQGRQTSVKNHLGEETKTTYNGPSGDIAVYTDPEGRTFTQNFDAQGRPTTAFMPDSPMPVRSVSYPNATTVVANEGGFTTTIGFDQKGRVVSETDWAGRTTQTTYDDVAKTITVTEPDGETSTMTYDKLDRMTQISKPGGDAITYEYKTRGLPDTVTRPDGGNLAIKKDKTGQLASLSIDGVPTLHVQKDALGRVVSLQSSDGAEQYKHDAAGHVTEIKTPDGTRSFTYNLAGEITAMSTDDGRFQTYGRDDAGRITTITDSAGGSMSFTYDKSGKLTGMADGNGRTTLLSYDAAGRLSGITYPNGVSFSKTYVPSPETDEENALVASLTDVDGVTWSYTYDGDENVTSASAGPGFVTGYGYDLEGNLKLVTDALGRKTERTWGELDNLLSLTLPSGKSQSWAYDEDGNPTSWTRADGTTVEYASDDVSEKTILPDGTVLQTIHGDDGDILDQGAPGGSVHTWGDGDTDVRFVELEDGATLALTYTADELLESVVATTPGGQVFETLYFHDAGGRIAEIQDPDGTVTAFTYDASGRLSTVVRPNGTSTEYTYGLGERPTKIVHEDGSQIVETYEYTYDAHGRLATAKTPGGDFTYSYDLLGRLVQAQKTGGPSEQRTYDAVGNVVTATSGGETRTYAVNVDDELVSHTGPNGTTTYTYTGRGALAQISGPGGTTKYTYDALDRLTQVTLPDGSTVSYKYDGTGRLLSRTDASGERRCLPLPATHLRLDDCAVTYAPGGVNEAARAFVMGPEGSILSRHGAGGPRFAWSDVKGSVVATTDQNGDTTGQYSYDAWGVRTTTSGEAFEYGYTGERQDAATGMVFLRTRHYAPSLGRFLTPDPAGAETGDPRSLHRYLYAVGDPLNRSDASGEMSSVEVISVSSIQSTLNMISTVVMTCVKQYAEGAVIDAVVGNLVRGVVSEAVVQPLIDALTPFTGLKKLTETQLHKVLHKAICGSGGNDLLQVFLGGNKKDWSFLWNVGTCGEDKNHGATGKPSLFGCSKFPKSIDGKNGIDIVYNGKLGFELKLSRRDARGSKGDKQTVRFCRWAAAKRTHLMTYLYRRMPSHAFNMKKAWKCWFCWAKSRAPRCNKPLAKVGSIYVAFGIKANSCKQRFFIAKPPTCKDVVSAAACH